MDCARCRRALAFDMPTRTPRVSNGGASVKTSTALSPPPKPATSRPPPSKQYVTKRELSVVGNPSACFTAERRSPRKMPPIPVVTCPPASRQGLGPKPLGVRVTRIASGVPIGGELEYADGVTISRALDARRDM